MSGKKQKVRRGQADVRKVSVERRNINPAKMPDVAARLQKVFGSKVISDREMHHLWAENRGVY